MEKLCQWWEQKHGIRQVMILVCFLYAISTPVVLIAGLLAM